VSGLQPDKDEAGADTISLLALGSALLRRRRIIVGFALVGVALGLGLALTSPRLYTSYATFIPQAAEQQVSALERAAGQLGIRGAGGDPAWGPPMYVELLKTRALLEPIALDTIVVLEENGRRATVSELLDIEDDDRARRTDRTVRALRRLVQPTLLTPLAAVKVEVTTPWPSVSTALVDKLVRGVNAFNIESRRSQAKAEREFVELQVAEAERTLGMAESRMEEFLRRNRAITGSPELTFERERLQRDVALRQELQTSWLKSREDARIREVRDIPVITVLEAARLPIEPESRGSVRNSLLGGIIFGILGVLVALVSHAVAGARRSSSEDAREFFGLLEGMTPNVLRRRSR
jgi:uncharacterized protein involved in exopolysaccharide biosynthesis